MLNADMDALFNDATIDEFVHAYTHGRLGHIKYNSCAAVVVFVGHPLVDGRIGENVDVVTNLEGEEVLREVGHTMFPEFLREHVARTRPGSE